jgi:hypothetical protein
MAEEKSLTVIEQKQVTFYEEEILAVRIQDNSILIPVRPICELLGVDWSAQRRRINRDPVLKEEMQSVVITATDSHRTISREVLSLPLDYVSGFLFGIDANRVKPELKDRLVRYQRECYRVLSDAFQEGQLTADSGFDELLKQANEEVVEAYQIAMAIVKLARNQIVMQGQVDSNTQRIEELESTLSDPGRQVTPDQASQISQAVKAVALVYGKQTGRNEFGGVYGEMYRKFGITSYKLLPAKKFVDAMRWLSDWYSQVTGSDEIPF